ncbi:GNAT family N-acetyltransferase [Auraticoccus sp. F435]|uniref:GNAT family N-acetyltransferase n=1 Tax=Auraticoccus cholistanensis TaxID=2656650 RepID=A0A6A9UY94_9ACTN|nr:GNAT family N-acetyltransferase [Auraticoccus cholistanensis]MVA76825.1 GNAT family N-acetyltransferase [Auraticoccus cholistanensis]
MDSCDDRPRLTVLGGGDLDEVAALLGRGMATNPLHLAVYGGDEEHRARCHARMVRALLAASPAASLAGVVHGQTLRGVAASVPPGRCQPAAPVRLRLLATALTLGPRTAARLLRWNRAWARHDPAEDHVHLGPVSVDRQLAGRGYGGLLLRGHVAELDAAGLVGYLETDRPGAVGFYRRFGYTVVGRAEVLGVPTWFMRRPPA